MKLKIRFADQIVGLFILLAIVGLAATLVFLGINQRWFAKNYHFHSLFKSGGGLSAGMSITLKGFEIGKADKITLDPKSRIVTMYFHIYEEFYTDVVLENSVIELATSPIGIGGGLFFHPGKDQDPLKPPIADGSFIPSLDFKQGMKLVRAGLVDKPAGGEDSIGSLLSQIGPIVEKVNNILYTIDELAERIDDAVRGETENNQIGALLHSTDALLVTVNNIMTGRDEGPVGDIIDDVAATTKTLETSLGNVLDNVRDTSDTVEASVVKITQDLTALSSDLRLITKNIEAITAEPEGLVMRLIDPKGSIKTLLDDDNVLFEKIEAMMESVRQIVAELEEFAGFVTGTAPQIAGLIEEGRAALAMSQDVMEALKNNPLLSGGVPEEKEQPTTFKSFRDEDF